MKVLISIGCEDMLKGIPVSPGYAIAKILKFEDYTFDQTKTIIQFPEQEIERYDDAIQQTVAQLEALKKTNKDKLDEETLHIFDAHIAMAKDPELIAAVKSKIHTEKCGLSYALSDIIDTFVQQFRQMEDTYLKSRVSDLLEVKDRILRNALHLPIIELDQISEPVILAIYELTATQAAQIDPKYVLGYMSEIGGKTSHSSIIARQLGIPAIVGIPDLLDHVKNDEFVIVDAFEGLLIRNYSHATELAYIKKLADYKQKKENLKTLNGKPTILKDGIELKLLANIGSAKDLKYLDHELADGVGLFRTELMYLDRTSLPSEQDLYEEYKAVLTYFDHKPVTIRTLDIGGDKPLPYLDLKSEYNPALGNRAIRLTFTRPNLFITQIKALLKASVYGNLHVMFPMISTLDELKHLKDIIDDCISSFEKDGIPYKRFKLGIMIEIPAAAIMADQLAAHVDFFSIGTNDLIQYTFAADRTNPDVEYLYQPFHPVVTRLIKMVVDAAHHHNIPVSVCGEMAGHPLGAQLLVGLGIRHLSMTPISILPIKDQLLGLTYEGLNKKAEQALTASSEDELMSYFL